MILFDLDSNSKRNAQISFSFCGEDSLVSEQTLVIIYHLCLTRIPHHNLQISTRHGTRTSAKTKKGKIARKAVTAPGNMATFRATWRKRCRALFDPNSGDWELCEALWSCVKLSECGCRWEYRIHSSMEFNDFLHLLLDWKLAVIDPWSVLCTLLTLSCHMVPFCVHAVHMPMSVNFPISPICSIFQTAHLNCSKVFYKHLNCSNFFGEAAVSSRAVATCCARAGETEQQSHRADWKRTDSDRRFEKWNLRTNRTRSEILTDIDISFVISWCNLLSNHVFSA